MWITPQYATELIFNPSTVSTVAAALGRLWRGLRLWRRRITASGRTTCGLLWSVRVAATALGLRVAATRVSGVASGRIARI